MSPAMTHSEREAMFAVRAAMSRLGGPQAPIASTPLERLQWMRRHFEEVERDIRMDLQPAPQHLSAIAAHCLILYMGRDDGAGA